VALGDHSDNLPSPALSGSTLLSGVMPGTPSTPGQQQQQPPPPPMSALPFDEEAKLVYGVILSLRNMVKKLSGRLVPSLRIEFRF